MRLERDLFSSGVHILDHEDSMDYLQNITEQQSQEDAFFVLDIGEIIQKIKIWKITLPRVKLFYAVKCNDYELVLETLSTLGVGFDCASKGEIKKVTALGVDPSRIIYAHPCKPASHLKLAATLGISVTTFDNEAELHKIKSICPKTRLLIRIRCDAWKVQCPLGIKFGVLPEDVDPLIKVARDLNLNVVGVAFHVGSGCEEPQVFSRAIMAAREVFDKLLTSGFYPYMLDIGGGFCGFKNFSLDSYASFINEALDNYFPEDSGVEVIAEPGRYIVASSFTLATMIIGKREVFDNDGEMASIMYYINDGVYGSFNCILYDHQSVCPSVLKLSDDSAELRCSIWGPTCDGLDQVVSDINLPNLNLGDWLVWSNMGAYTIAAAGTFNGFPIPHVHATVSMHVWSYFEDLKLNQNYLKPNSDESQQPVSPATFHSSFPEDSYYDNTSSLIDLFKL